MVVSCVSRTHIENPLWQHLRAVKKLHEQDLQKRLARFNFGIFVKLFKSHGVPGEWGEEVLPKSYEAELVEDMLSLLSSFSAKISGRRKAGCRKKKTDGNS